MLDNSVVQFDDTIEELSEFKVTGFGANEILHINSGGTAVASDSNFIWDTNGLFVKTTNGIDIGAGVAEDINLITVDEGTADANKPRLFWDESEDKISANKGFYITQESHVINTNFKATANARIVAEDTSTVSFGSSLDAHLYWARSDADAHMLLLTLPLGDATNVSVFAIGNNNANVDLGFFDGITQPRIAVIDADADSYIWMGHSADDTPTISASSDLKIMPDVQGDGIFFGDADVGDAVDGGSIWIWRKAEEGNDALRLFINKFRQGQLTTTGVFSFTAGGALFFNSVGGTFMETNGDYRVEMFSFSGSGDNQDFRQYGYITAAGTRKYIQWTVEDSDDKFHLTRQSADILAFAVDMPMELPDDTALSFGNSQDVSVDFDSALGVGMFDGGNWLMNSTNQLQFGDSGTHIAQLTDGHLDLTADISVDVNGYLVSTNGRTLNETRYTAVDTIPTSDDIVWGDTDGGAFTLTLHDGVGGNRHEITNSGTSGNALTIAADASDTIDGGATLILYDGETAIIHFDSNDNEWRP